MNGSSDNPDFLPIEDRRRENNRASMRLLVALVDTWPIAHDDRAYVAAARHLTAPVRLGPGNRFAETLSAIRGLVAAWPQAGRGDAGADGSARSGSVDCSKRSRVPARAREGISMVDRNAQTHEPSLPVRLITREKATGPFTETEYTALSVLADRLARALRLSYSEAHRAVATAAREIVAEGRPIESGDLLEAVRARVVAMSERVAAGCIQ